jgi:hypothetical protein
MRTAFVLVFFLSCLAARAQNCPNVLVLRGAAKSKHFTSVLLNSRGAYQSDQSQPELPATAWTCNSVGVPKCYTRALFRFDLKALPKNAVVTSAKLHLFAKKNNLNGHTGTPMYGDNNTCVIQRVTSTWKASSIGWNNQPYVSGEGIKVLKKTNYQAKNFVVDITDFARRWVRDPSSNYGMLLRLQNEQQMNSMIFESGKGAPSRQPMLEICYTLQGSTVKDSLPLDIPPVPPVVFPLASSENPIVISNLKGLRLQSGVHLEWSVAHSSDSLFVDVERSDDSLNFKKIEVPVKRTKGKNEYTATDANAILHNKYYYRLKVFTRRSKVQYSRVIAVKGL